MKRVCCLFILGALSCGSGSAVTPPPTPPPCDQKCKDKVAIRAVRETVKLAFNMTFQGKPVGSYDLAISCPQGGTARVTGSAKSNALQGATEVSITYTLVECGYLRQDDDAEQNYETRLTGIFTQEGVIAVQPTAPSALIMKSSVMKIEGTVYDPPLEYKADCPLQLGQSGNALSGKICDRNVEADL